MAVLLGTMLLQLDKGASSELLL